MEEGTNVGGMHVEVGGMHVFAPPCCDPALCSDLHQQGAIRMQGFAPSCANREPLPPLLAERKRQTETLVEVGVLVFECLRSKTDPKKEPKRTIDKKQTTQKEKQTMTFVEVRVLVFECLLQQSGVSHIRP